MIQKWNRGVLLTVASLVVVLITLTTGCPSGELIPEISVMQGATEILSGTGTYSFCTVVEGTSSAPVGFTILN